MLKVLQVIGQMGFGGAELMTAQVAPRLISEKIDVEVLVLGNYQHEVLSQLRAAGVVVHAPEANLGSLLNTFRVAKIVAERSIDIVHAHLFPSLYWAALAKFFCSPRVRWVYTEHSTSNGRRKRSWLRPLERWVYSRFDVVSCVSTEVRTALLEWVPGARTAVIENGIDIERYAAALPICRTSLGLSEQDTVVVTVGAFRREKNHAMLMKAFALLPDSYALVLAGAGVERAHVEQLATDLGVHARVRFLGAFAFVEGLYKMADVYVLASHSEGFGISALEAAAAGVPIAYSNVAGLTEMLDGAGWPVDPSSADSIAAGIIRAASSGRNSAQVAHGLRVALRYSIAMSVEKHGLLYRGIPGLRVDRDQPPRREG